MWVTDFWLCDVGMPRGYVARWYDPLSSNQFIVPEALAPFGWKVRF